MRRLITSPWFRGTVGLALAVLACGEWWSLESAYAQSKAQSKKGAAKKPAPVTPPPPPVPMRKIVIDKVDTGVSGRQQMVASAAKIDKLIEANYAKYKVKPNPTSSDEQFVRRAYLDITGTIPEFKQARLFLTGHDTEKRMRLIDTLLNGPNFAGHLYNYWADVLRLKENLTNNVPGRPYAEWVKESIETNKPYDKFVFEMLTASGRVFDDPAAGYILRDSGMPLDALNNTIRIFLGTRIGCAQCHDHPFDKWTRREFYEMAAFTFATSTRRGAGDKKFGGGNVVNKLRDELKKVDTKFDGGGKYNRFLQGNLVEVFDTNNKLTLPSDYQYDNAKPKGAVTMKAIFDPQPKLEKTDSPRVAFAKWLTSRDNPRFTKTIVNRLWKKCFGVGLIEPEDDIQEDTKPENPELLAFLESEMKRLNYDVKEFVRIIYNTKAYQREATHAEVTPGEEYHFPGPILRRMTAEQVWDSFITLAVFDPENYQMEPARVQAKLLDVDLTKATADEIFKRDQELREATSSKTKDARDKPFRYSKFGQTLLLVRASELPSPLPPGHFLRQFGQSDRESIQQSSDDGSVPQVLQMFNGPITHMLLEEKSLMYKNVTAEKAASERIDVIFLTILSRRATPEERVAAQDEIKGDGNAGYGNVIWALVNTREFLFLQ